MTELLQEVEARERANPLRCPSPKRGNGKTPPTAATLFLGDKPHCCYCNGDHSPGRCSRVAKTEERKQIIMKTGRCFMCLRKGHLIRLCRSKQRCNVCGGKHHFSICTSSGQTESATTGLNPASVPPFQPPTTTSTLLVNARGPVLLQTAIMQTAIIKLFNPEEPKRSIEVKAILGTGSQQSYATKKVKDALALKCLEMLVMTFGASDKKVTKRLRPMTLPGLDKVRPGARDGVCMCPLDL